MSEYQQKLEALPPNRDDLRNLFDLALALVTANIATAKAEANAYTDADNQTGKVIDPDGMVFPPEEMTASAALPAASFVQLNHATVAIAATVVPTAGQLLVVTQADAGTAGHTLTTVGTFDGTNNTATFNAQYETLVLFALSSTRWVILGNFGSVGLSAVP